MSTTATKTDRFAFLEKFGAEWDKARNSVVYFGDTAAEIAAFNDESTAALVPVTGSGVLLHEGADALDLLQRLSTNDLLQLEPGKSAFTVLTSERGRAIDVLNVAVLANDRLMLLSGSSDVNPAKEWIDRFTIIEDAEISDVTDKYVRFALIGGSTFTAVESAFDVQLQRNAAVTLSDTFEGSFLVSSRWAETDRIDLVTPIQLAEAVWLKLLETGAVPTGEEAYQAVRITKGVPSPGTELTEDSNPLEVGLKDLISFSKGCYVGQEVVARLDTYDKLQRRLVKLESEDALVVGEDLTSMDGKRAGTVTSVSSLVQSDIHLALGFARRNYWDDGTVLKCGDAEVTVRSLPEPAPFS